MKHWRLAIIDILSNSPTKKRKLCICDLCTDGGRTGGNLFTKYGYTNHFRHTQQIELADFLEAFWEGSDSIILNDDKSHDSPQYHAAKARRHIFNELVNAVSQ